MRWVLVLAAGSSTRMGHSKQMISFRGEPLLVHTLKEALKVSPNVAVVLGSSFDKHRQLIFQLHVTIVENKNWELGMGSSIKAGLNQILEKDPGADEIIILVCDQPLLTADHLGKLITSAEGSASKIIASTYANTRGVPALFKKGIFPKILELHDNKGAKVIIDQSPAEVAVVEFPGGEIDLDTPADLKGFEP